MPDPLTRGAVVLRHGRFSVVWHDTGRELVLLPIIKPRRPEAYDVELGLPDMVACAVTILGAVIRPRMNAPVPAEGHRQVGAVPGTTMCRVVHGLARVEAEAATHAKWSAGDRHRRCAADDRCVNLTAAPAAPPAPRPLRAPLRQRETSKHG